MQCLSLDVPGEIKIVGSWVAVGLAYPHGPDWSDLVARDRKASGKGLVAFGGIDFGDRNVFDPAETSSIELVQPAASSHPVCREHANELTAEKLY